MTAPLADLMGWADDPEPGFGPDDVAGWPAGALDRLVAAGVVAVAGATAAVRCPGCDQDHVEPVRWAGAPGRRAFVTCPEVGLVPVPPAALRRWAVRHTGLARAVAAAVGVADEPAEVVSARVWRLGPVRTAGRARVGFLAVGLDRPDGAAVAEAAPELTAAHAVVFVPSLAPRRAVWPADRNPTVVRLTDVLALGPVGLVADWSVLHALLTPGTTLPAPVAPVLVVPPGVTWDQVTIILDDHHLTVRVGGVSRRVGFVEAGFENRRRSGVPDARWALLTMIAQRGGVLESGDAVRTKAGALKQAVSDLRARLRALLGLDDNPFYPVRKAGAYRARFTVRAGASAGFPTPPGAAWDDLTLSAAGPNFVRVEVRTTTVGVAFLPAVDGDSGGRHEPVTADGERGGRYTLSDLGLVGTNGRPTRAAAALAAVLQAGGRAPRPDDDPAMLALGKALTAFFRLDGSPFEFRTPRTWVARFGVGPVSASGHG
ncbi:MAG TPA: hypothetical protein VD866_32340 [Urbifossiella sp.]|nr:hypothetical protein [Urbifossiella sp.]